MLHQIVDIGNQIYLCCFSTNWTVTVNYSQESASAKTKQEDQQSERRERSSSPNEFISTNTQLAAAEIAEP